MTKEKKKFPKMRETITEAVKQNMRLERLRQHDDITIWEASFRWGARIMNPGFGTSINEAIYNGFIKAVERKDAIRNVIPPVKKAAKDYKPKKRIKRARL